MSVCNTPFDIGPEMNLPRYKYVVQVVIGEQRGEGVRMGSRCFWDSETDNVASETYVNVRAPRVAHIQRGALGGGSTIAVL